MDVACVEEVAIEWVIWSLYGFTCSSVGILTPLAYGVFI